MVRMLIERGADIHLKDQFGLNPFMMCALRSKYATCLGLAIWYMGNIDFSPTIEKYFGVLLQMPITANDMSQKF